ncbi:hypothetical protein ARMSODRAFT_1002352 [Armillaria solidipes]|uniref:F-box domain-containing protein n=1 Tax=Armillaria solidipes TaxID=1076256 RepID=A0A2H3C7P0_9AGAR|nr:hypothetical protein ARMSODRAFT_1002352 [Armillaria solidipes]
MADALRRSSRTKIPSKEQRLAMSETSSEQKAEEEWHSDENECCSGSEFEGSYVKSSRAKRMRRSSKTATAAKGKNPAKPKRKQAKKRGRDLSMLPTMPLDILFTICSMLNARDLINLSRVDANFCRTLTAQNVSFVWKTVRESEGGIEPPRGVPEYRWVDLLFGIALCDFCPAKNVRIDWMLRRRVCNKCLKSNLVCVSKVAQHMPDVDATVLSLVPRTRSASAKMSSLSGYYWRSDITDMQAKIKEIGADDERLAKFRVERQNLIKYMTEDAERCKHWPYDFSRRKSDESDQRRDERSAMIILRLLELGYNQRDVNVIKSHPSLRRDAELTSNSWNSIRPGLEAAIQEYRALHAEEDRSNSIRQRTDVLNSMYKTYKQQFLPVIWREMPALVDICMFPVFKAIIERPTEENVTEVSFTEAMSELPTLIADWQQRRDTELRALIPVLETQNPSQADTYGSANVVDPLKLATAVFSCERRCPAMFATDIWRHHCASPQQFYFNNAPIKDVDDLYSRLGNSKLSFDALGSAVAASLIRLASRDPTATTAEEMDSLDLHYLCINDGHCMYKATAFLPRWPVLSWRECVERNAGREYRLLTSEEESKMRLGFRGSFGLGRRDTVFYCQLCSDNLDASVYEEIIEHVRDVHGIDNPQIDRDLFLAPGASLPEQLQSPRISAMS